MKKIFTLLASVVILAACSDEIDRPVPDAEPIPINISTIVTRLTDAGYEAGDKVGIYVVNEPKSLATSGNHVDNMGFTYSGVWTPDTPIFWADQHTKADFYCYYPYAATISNVSALPISVKADQSTEANYRASEFTWGKVEGVAPTDEAVALTTPHTMSKLLIEFKAGKGFTDEALAAAQKRVRICNVKTNATVNLATGVATATGATTEVTPYADDATNYHALLVPQTIAAGTDLVTIEILGVTYNFTREEAMTFNSNKCVKCTITIDKINNGVNVGVGEWEEEDEDFGGIAD